MADLASDGTVPCGNCGVDRRPTFERDADDPNAIEIECADQYYGTHYSRGHWPTIRAMGDWLMLWFGEEAEVRYGGDTSAGWDELQPYPPQRQANDEHWRTRGHSPYRETCGCDHCSTLNPPVSPREQAQQ